jgi:OTU domain-containing protein 6
MASAGASIPSSADYKKALKTLEGEKRAALKKAKALKGSKGKEGIAQIEEEFIIKFQQLLEQYTTTTSNKDEEAVGGEPEATTGTSTSVVDSTTSTTSSQPPPDHADNDDEEEAERQRKLLKVQRKKEKQRQKERERHEQELQAEAEAMAGPNMKQQEWDQIQTHLQPLQLTVKQVVADGHCLYRAVGAQTGHDHTQIRTCMGWGLVVATV